MNKNKWKNALIHTLSLHLSIYISIYISIYVSIYLSIDLSNHLPLLSKLTYLHVPVTFPQTNHLNLFDIDSMSISIRSLRSNSIINWQSLPLVLLLDFLPNPFWVVHRTRKDSYPIYLLHFFWAETSTQ